MKIESIFLHPDWIMTRYAGWRTIHRDAQCLMLEKGRRPIRRVCILSSLPLINFFDRYDLAKFCDGMTRLTLKVIPPDDFAAVIAKTHGLMPTPDAQRIFHKYTFVIDLSLAVDQIWMAMRPTNRNLCKKATQAGIRVRIETAPSEVDIDRFLNLYGEMASLRGLGIPQKSMLREMFANRQLIMSCAERDGVTLSIALVYIAGAMAMYLFGVSPGRSVDGAGQLLQWELMQTLKARGTTVYDLGGVPSIDESDGIYKFKKGFGGQGLALGAEFDRVPAWIEFIKRIRQWCRK